MPRHEISDPDPSGFGVVLGLKNHRIFAIPPFHGDDIARGR